MDLFHFTDKGETILQEGFYCPISFEYLSEFSSHISLMSGIARLLGIQYRPHDQSDASEAIQRFLKKHPQGTLIWVTSDPDYEHDLVQDCLRVHLPKGAIELMANGYEFVYFVELPRIPPTAFLRRSL